MGSSSADYREALFVRHGLAFLLASSSETACFYPIDTLKTLLQVNAGAGRKLDVSSIVEEVSKSTGFRGLYGGVGWQLSGRICSLGVRFGTYELMRAYFCDGREDDFYTAAECFLGGFVAGAAESVINTPYEFCKVRGQITGATSGQITVQNEIYKQQRKSRNLPPGYLGDAHWERIRRTVSVLPSNGTDIVPKLKGYPWLATGSGQPPLVGDVEGVRGAVSLEGSSVVWRGLRPGLFRDGMYGGFFFCGWEFLDKIVTEARAYMMKPPPTSWDEVSPSSPWQLSITAGVAASFAATASHSFDFAKTRVQATVIPKHMSMERKLLKWKMPGSWLERLMGFNPLDRKFLWRGLGLRALQHGFGTFALVLTYNASVQAATLYKG